MVANPVLFPLISSGCQLTMASSVFSSTPILGRWSVITTRISERWYVWLPLHCSVRCARSFLFYNVPSTSSLWSMLSSGSPIACRLTWSSLSGIFCVAIIGIAFVTAMTLFVFFNILSGCNASGSTMDPSANKHASILALRFCILSRIVFYLFHINNM